MRILALLFLSFSAFAAPDCDLFKGRACIYLPAGKTTSTLHLYIRGHHKGRRDFDPLERSNVALATLSASYLRPIPTAEKSNGIVVATGSSAVSFTLKDIEDLEEKYQQHFTEVTLSAHSGGYWGLNETLINLRARRSTIKQVLMLDSFYATKEEELLEVLREYHLAGVPCRGFMTDHNVKRVKEHYQFCEVEGPKNLDHNNSVGPFLERHL